MVNEARSQDERTSAGPGEDPLLVTVWGPPEPPRRLPQPGIRHIVAGLLGAILLPLIPGTIILSQALSNDGQASGDVEEQVRLAITSNGPLLVSSLILTWVALTLPVLLAGRLTNGGWRALVHWEFNWRRDIPIALAFAVGLHLAQVGIAYGLSFVGLNTNELGNTGQLTAAGPGWAILIGIGAVVGAPITEELFFRGLVLRVLARKVALPAAVLISSLLFGMLHIQDNFASSLYTVTATSILGLILALLVLKTGRLGTSVLSHAAFNGISVIVVLVLPALTSS